MQIIKTWILSLVMCLLVACGSTAAEQPAQVAPTTLPAPTPPTQTETAPTSTPPPVTVEVVAPATPTSEPAAPSTTEAVAPTPLAVEPTTELSAESTASSEGAMPTGAFVKEEVPVSGSFTLDPTNKVLHLSDDFKVEPGPDLVILLSGASNLTLDYNAFGKTVTAAPMVTLGPLVNPAGAQDYTIPAGTDLSLYNTVVVWCQSFNVAFAAAPLH